jgi:hypothetical protein
VIVDPGDHPRPQLTRERWADLCGTWAFAYDDADVGLSQRWVDRPRSSTARSPCRIRRNPRRAAWATRPRTGCSGTGFCYTQLTDVQQERNGLLDDRRRPKVDPAAIRRIDRRPAAAVPADEIESFTYPRTEPRAEASD